MKATALGTLAASLGLVIASAAAAASRAPAVTVYTRDLGLVRETVALEPAAGDTVRISDMPERLDFSSVRLVPTAGKVTRLAWRYDTESGDRMIEAARGSRVSVRSRGDRAIEGVLVTSDPMWLVVRTDDGGLSTLARQAVEEVRLVKPPAMLSVRPTLEAVIEGAGGRKSSGDIAYLTGGLSWSAEHMVIRRGENSVEWSANVTVDNTSGRDYVGADLKLVAGEPRRVMPPQPQPYVRGFASALPEASMAKAAPDLSEQSFSEYHLYTLDRPATLRDREQQSLTMIAPHTVQMTPRYVYHGGDPRGVTAQLELVNDTKSGLGVPLPAGRVRIYEADASGGLQLTGETPIKHTAEGEKVTLEVGSAFDIAAERKQLDDKRISDREREYTVEISLRNRKKAAVTVRVDDPASGDVTVLKSTHDSTRPDANTLRFEVPVPAGKEVLVRYTARVRY
jgi:hypothetical protein